MHAIKPVIQLAKERALFRFSALAIRMLQDVNVSIRQVTPATGSVNEQKTISAAKEWLATQEVLFLKRLNVSYSDYVERGMQTMYRDLRHELRDVSANTWALIDDETITRQIDVERRVLRLRDADQLSLGRLNLMIAQLHDEHDVRERENPFRPYLMARALHDVLCEMSATSDLCAMLFDHMSGALATELPEYFAAIREVFESNGVHARLLARPASLNRRDREMLIPQGQNFPQVIYSGATHSAGDQSANAGNNSGNNLSNNAGNQSGHYSPNFSLPPALEHMLSLMQQRTSDGHNVLHAPEPEEQTALQDFVWKIFGQVAPDRVPSHPRQSDNPVTEFRPLVDDDVSKPHALTSQLHRLQQEAVNGAVREEAIQLLDLHSELETERLSEMERVAMDVVAMLFNFIANDDSIPDAFRVTITRLQVPFLKAAMLVPRILEQPDNAPRKLLNRMASLAIGLDAQTPLSIEIHAEMVVTVEKILNDFKTNLIVFADALTQFDEAIARILRESDPEILRVIEALDEAEKDPKRYDVLIVETVNALRERLQTIQTDQRAVDFLIRIWSRVLVHANEDESIDSQPFRDVVPELIWSVYQHDLTERGALMKLLRRLVRQVKQGMKLIALPETETKQAIDDLIAMHAAVLGTIQSTPLKASVKMETLHQHFASLKIGSVNAEAATIHAPTVSQIRLQSALQKFNVAAHQHLDNDMGTLLSSDAGWLGGMQVGTVVEWWANNVYQPARLMWVNPQQSFYILQLAASNEQPRLLIYSSISLIKALREGSIGMIEYAPIFDRAIESLLDVAEVRQPISV
ncbi:DUF1631 family protein [Herminiimonas fonticola]|uniref:Uncharacterized protein DUF1631 n=1 Tax=Herminiimonas fonticola TaxID=303380 RepID=A0A4R6G1K2_9BURK|nr:DUF1631 family protein [Herminiimonas fonticola]RBA23519.1 Protein of unknown function (DUF1631) [Herminiimonas fonticola]TDN88226.1 uncharacterized protein DUF1631 [Herminiimonas fonticola]